MANYLRHFARTCMVRKGLKHSIFKHTNGLLKCIRRHTSVLYITGRRGMEVFSYLSPYLDFDNKLQDVDKLQKELASRGLDMDVGELKKMWEFYKSVNADNDKLELRNTELTSQMREFYQKETLTEKEEQQFAKLKLQSKVLKQDLKGVKNALWDLGESVIEKLLKLPNEVDQKTPFQSPIVVKRSGELNQSSSVRKNHIEIGKTLGLLEYKNPMQYYLCNDAALFELGVLNYAGEVFSGDDMIRVTGSDFSRSLVVEGSGLNHEDPTDAFIINNHSEVEENSPNRMHLVGGASLISFLAMHAKQLINPKHFPVRYFSTGRQYTPFPPGSTQIGLFTVCQTSAVHAFVLVKDANSPEYRLQLERLLNTVSELYDNLCNHYQIVMRPATELRPWETMRLSFELWSSFSKQYIEVGHISLCGDYFSKRLRIAYQTDTGRDFPSVISGTVLSVPRLLGCLLEQNPDKFIIPSKIAQYMPADYSLF